jgi:phosphate starvation-inducible protein PhoH and related proteins
VATKARQARRKTEQVADKTFTPKPTNHAQYQAKSNLHTHPIQFLIGGPGTGKTHCAISLAWDLLCAGKCDRIVVTRPVVSCGGEQIGHLPGDLNEKMSPWLAPILDCLTIIIGDRRNAESVMKNFEFLPIAHVRGRSFLAGTVAICDEIQNLTQEQLYAYMTRFCDGSYMFLCGDPTQSDLRDGSSHLARIAISCENKGVSVTVPFTDVLPVRSRRLAGMAEAFRDARNSV